MLRPQSVGTKVKVVPPILSPPRRRCPKVVSCPETAVSGENPGVLRPVHKIRRGEAIEIGLVLESYGSRWEDPEGVFVDAYLWIRIEAWEEWVVDREVCWNGEREDRCHAEAFEADSQGDNNPHFVYETSRYDHTHSVGDLSSFVVLET